MNRRKSCSILHSWPVAFPAAALTMRFSAIQRLRLLHHLRLIAVCQCCSIIATSVVVHYQCSILRALVMSGVSAAPLYVPHCCPALTSVFSIILTSVVRRQCLLRFSGLSPPFFHLRRCSVLSGISAAPLFLPQCCPASGICSVLRTSVMLSATRRGCRSVLRASVISSVSICFIMYTSVMSTVSVWFFVPHCVYPLHFLHSLRWQQKARNVNGNWLS